MRRRAVAVAWLALIWVSLWRDLSPGVVLVGVVLGIGLVALVPVTSAHARYSVNLVAVVKLFFYFLYKLVEASLIVAWEVLTPQSRINQGIVAVPIRGVSDGVTSLVANMITLTPGTVTLEVRSSPATLYIHVLHLRTLEEARQEVRTLETMAIAAFAPHLADIPMPESRQEQEEAR